MNIENSDLNTSKNNSTRFNLEEFAYQNRIPIAILLVGFIFIGLGILAFKKEIFNKDNVEILKEDTVSEYIVVEVSGAVENPGVYKITVGSRIEDALIASGGVSADADREWMDRYLNRASVLSDGQKIYIPEKNEPLSNLQNKQSDILSAKSNGVDQTTSISYSNPTEEKVNINSASQKKLEELPGIGPVYAQNIIEQRPYSKVEELMEKSVLKKSTYEKIKDLISVY